MHPTNLRTPAELALVAVTLASLAAFSRLFVDVGAVAPLALVVVTGHGLALTARRRNWSAPLAVAAAAVAFVLVVTWVFYLHTTVIGLPTTSTVDAVIDDLRAAWTTLGSQRAPVEPLRGFLVSAALGFWLVALLSDGSAFRVGGAVEATAPAGGMFVLSSLLGTGGGRVPATLGFVAAVLAFLLLYRVARQEASPGWVDGDAARGGRALLRTGVVLIVAAVGAGVVVGPALPGAGADGLIDWRGRDDGGARVTVSPLVDIRSRLVEDRDVEVFRVTVDGIAATDDPAGPGDAAAIRYWRMTALDHFDASRWTLEERPFRAVDVGDDLVTGAPAGPRVRQSFTTTGLGGAWLPTAFRATGLRSVTGADGAPTVRHNEELGALLVDDAADIETYAVESVLPVTDPAVLANALTPPGPLAARYLRLPDGMEAVRAEAERIVAAAGAVGAHARASALADHFHDPSRFGYSTDVAAGQGRERVEDFLFPDDGGVSLGYCEQFASSYAALARAIGLPTRVAVGFTAGEPLPGSPATFVVRGEHAHAWPEVWFSGVGWVPFEPTPGRGAAGGADPGAEAPTADDPPAPTTTVADGGQDAPGDADPSDADDAAGSPGAGGPGPATPWGWWLASGTIAVAGLYVALVLGGRGVRTAMRRLAGQPARRRIDRAWAESQDALRLIGVEPATAETPVEYAARTGHRSEVAGDVLVELAELTTAARYGPGDPQPGEVERAEATSRDVSRRIRRSVPLRRRLRHDLDPRRLRDRGFDV
ncbi:MAG: DUF3488 and transglutaminase-like domain-containing protein [Actinomycetota bacterium]|nr:DUF3488 and transglutaminase-like domain-containing protein [Actinomycetota bacterium]